MSNNFVLPVLVLLKAVNPFIWKRLSTSDFSAVREDLKKLGIEDEPTTEIIKQINFYEIEKLNHPLIHMDYIPKSLTEKDLYFRYKDKNLDVDILCLFKFYYDVSLYEKDVFYTNQDRKFVYQIIPKSDSSEIRETIEVELSINEKILLINLPEYQKIINENYIFFGEKINPFSFCYEVKNNIQIPLFPRYVSEEIIEKKEIFIKNQKSGRIFKIIF